MRRRSVKPVATQLGQQSRPRDAEQQSGLATIAAGEIEHRPEVTRFGSRQRLGSRLLRGIHHHKIDRPLAPPARSHHPVAGGSEIGLQPGDVIAGDPAGQQTDVKLSHPAKLARPTGPHQRRTATHPPVTLWDQLTPENRVLDLNRVAVGDQIQHPLLVVDLVVRSGDHPRTVLSFGNRTGRIDSAPFWAGRDEALRGITKGMLVQVVGTVTSYRDALQLDVTSLRPLPRGEVPLSELVPSVGSVERYWSFLDELRQRFTAPRLRAVVDLFYADEAFRQRYEQCPGSPGTGHHAALGGLLQHTSEVVGIGRSIARIARADEELVIAGAMLHDIGKLAAYRWEDGVFETTERGRLAGHVVIGAMMFRSAWATAATPPCSADEADLIEHLILSHHGKLEFGSPVRPLTLEAEILHFADDASAKTASISETYAMPEFFGPGARVSSRRVWQLDNRWLFRLPIDFGRSPDDAQNEAADQSG